MYRRFNLGKKSLFEIKVKAPCTAVLKKAKKHTHKKNEGNDHSGEINKR